MKFNFLLLSLLSIIILFGCEDPEPNGSPPSQLEGIWAFNKNGTSTKINISYINGKRQAAFLSFGNDNWGEYKEFIVGDFFIRDISNRTNSKEPFYCVVVVLENSRTYKESASIILASDGKSFDVMIDDKNYVTLYKLSDEPIKSGNITFWTGSDNGKMSIELEGIGSRNLIYYIRSGIPTCGSDYTVYFTGLPYGLYKYNATSYGLNKSGTVNVNTGCSVIELK